MRFLFYFMRNGLNYETQLPGDEAAEGNAFPEKTHLLRNQRRYNIIFCIILLTSNII